jgi:hypothetical protein
VSHQNPLTSEIRQWLRKSNKKTLDDTTGTVNPDYFQQKEGRGWSYSLDKHCASRLGWNINAFHFEKYLGMDQKQSLRHLRKKGFIGGNQTKDDVTVGSGYYTCVGKYLVRKEDILLATDSRQEMEIVADPNKVALIDYYFLNLMDYFTTKFIRSYSSAHTRKYEKREKSLRVLNEWIWFDYYRPLVSQYFRENPSRG